MQMNNILFANCLHHNKWFVHFNSIAFSHYIT